ncbi:hypothetical protein L3V82_11665 [Thiotrichales bacterium 19S3-7]|nr:hypothetical protein [Thiotrichales bacterium 19S3-7]MCF6802870.1 hypothetical protein [Thiotrichales bacterium 19S3-11]
MFTFKLIGCVLLIISCMVGAGILALPLMAYQLGVFLTSVIIIIFYILMCISGLLTLEVSSQLPLHKNHFSSIGQFAFGQYGKYITAGAFVIAIYGAMIAYIAASEDLLSSILSYFSLSMQKNYLGLLFVLIIGGIVIISMACAEKLNRLMMLLKLSTLLLSIFILSHYAFSGKSMEISLHFNLLSEATLVIALAFCYQLLIPSLVNYLGKEHLIELKYVIICSTTITCFIYLLWSVIIVGYMDSLQANHSGINSFSQLMIFLNQNGQLKLVANLIHGFLEITVFASFIAVSIAFIDFWIDVLNLTTKFTGRLVAGILVYLPAYLAVTFYENIFIGALSISGYFGLVYALLIPSLAAMNTYDKANYQYIFGGKTLRLILVIISIIIMLFTLLSSL